MKNLEQLEARLAAAAGTSIDDPRPQFEYISGAAGSGKTYLARELVQKYGGELCATTGIAAMNLGAGVTTINSLLGFFDTPSLRDKWITGGLTRKLGQLWASGCRRLVLDEVSMMDGEQLSILVQAIDDLEKTSERGLRMGLTLVGDFCQLPPVKAKFAFEIPEAWERFGKNTTKLTEIRRQTDKEFIQALQAVRAGRRADAVDYFASKIERSLVQDFSGCTVLAKNDEVDRFNSMRAAQLKATPVEFEAKRWGKERSEWKNIPDKLLVKEGGLVMLLANEKELDAETGAPVYPTNYLYVNGDLGEFLGRNESGYCEVRRRRDGEVVEVSVVTRENLVPCDKERRKELRESHPDLLRGDPGQEKWEIVGAVTYMPMRYAWASTCHKTQGLTLDQVQVQIGHAMWAQGGMLYVGLSRARSAAGLRIVGSKELLAARINVDPRVKGWL